MKFRYFALAAAVLAAACGKTPDTVPQEVSLTVPQNVKLHSATETSLTFQWGTVEGATGYNWKLTLDGTQVKGASAKNRNVVVEGLTPGTTYGFSVCAVAGEKTSAWSSEISAKTDGTVPTPPDPSAKTVCVDAPLTLELSSTPVLGTSGYIRVFRKDGTKVDEINLADISKTVTLEDGTMIPAGADADNGKIAIGNDYVFHTFMDALHSGQYRVVHYTPLRIKGKTLEIKLHNEALSFGESYYVTVDESVAGKAVAEEDMPFTVKARHQAHVGPRLHRTFNGARRHGSFKSFRPDGRGHARHREGPPLRHNPFRQGRRHRRLLYRPGRPELCLNALQG